MAKHRTAPRRQHDTHKLREVRQQVGGIRDHPLRLVRRQALGRKPSLGDRQHRVDEQAVATGRGDAAGRRVRADDEPHFLEVGHHVADGRRREFQP